VSKHRPLSHALIDVVRRRFTRLAMSAFVSNSSLFAHARIRPTPKANEPGCLGVRLKEPGKNLRIMGRIDWNRRRG
jgi:hypothetical protein